MIMITDKTISIIIPCYNMQDKVGRCIDSIKQQSYSNFVAYFIDDGSNDNTAEIIKQMISDDSRMDYIYQENGGLSSARNTGIKLAHTAFICFIDSDDYIRQDYLEKLVTPLLDGSYDLSACYFERVYESKTTISRFNYNDLLLCKHPAAWNKMYRLDIIKENHLEFPKGLWYEDLCFFAQMVPYCKNVKIIEESLYYYVQNPNSIMYTYSDKIYDIFKVFDLLNNNSSIDKKILEYMEVYHVLVGTVFRASFKPGFNKKELKKIVGCVEDEYPYWYKNSYIRSQLPLFYKIYLYFIRMHWYGFVTLMLKLLNKHVSL